MDTIDRFASITDLTEALVQKAAETHQEIRAALALLEEEYLENRQRLLSALSSLSLEGELEEKEEVELPLKRQWSTSRPKAAPNRAFGDFRSAFDSVYNAGSLAVETLEGSLEAAKAAKPPRRAARRRAVDQNPTFSAVGEIPVDPNGVSIRDLAEAILSEKSHTLDVNTITARIVGLGRENTRRDTVRKMLDRLVEAGKAERVSPGRYRAS